MTDHGPNPDRCDRLNSTRFGRSACFCKRPHADQKRPFDALNNSFSGWGGERFATVAADAVMDWSSLVAATGACKDDSSGGPAKLASRQVLFNSIVFWRGRRA
jgi:hypothetical protein